MPPDGELRPSRHPTSPAPLPTPRRPALSARSHQRDRRRRPKPPVRHSTCSGQEELVTDPSLKYGIDLASVAFYEYQAESESRVPGSLPPRDVEPMKEQAKRLASDHGDSHPASRRLSATIRDATAAKPKAADTGRVDGVRDRTRRCIWQGPRQPRDHHCPAMEARRHRGFAIMTNGAIILRASLCGQSQGPGEDQASSFRPRLGGVTRSITEALFCWRQPQVRRRDRVPGLRPR